MSHTYGHCSIYVCQTNKSSNSLHCIWGDS